MDYADKAKLLGIDRGRLAQDKGFEIEVPSTSLTQECETYFEGIGAPRPRRPLEDLTALNPKQSPISAYHVKKFWKTMPKAKARAIIAKRKVKR